MDKVAKLVAKTASALVRCRANSNQFYVYTIARKGNSYKLSSMSRIVTVSLDELEPHYFTNELDLIRSLSPSNRDGWWNGNDLACDLNGIGESKWDTITIQLHPGSLEITVKSDDNEKNLEQLASVNTLINIENQIDTTFKFHRLSPNERARCLCELAAHIKISNTLPSGDKPLFTEDYFKVNFGV